MTTMTAGSIYQDEHLTLDFRAGSAAVDSRRLILTRKEFELLAMLASNEGEIVPRLVLLASVWGYHPEVRTRTLDVHIRRLRKKLGAYGERYIQTVFGVGYRFQRYREPRVFTSFGLPLMAAGAAAA